MTAGDLPVWETQIRKDKSANRWKIARQILLIDIPSHRPCTWMLVHEFLKHHNSPGHHSNVGIEHKHVRSRRGLEGLIDSRRKPAIDAVLDEIHAIPKTLHGFKRRIL